MFTYKNEITLKNRFNKSTNIIYDEESCKDYIITQSTKDTLYTLFKLNYHNSIALIGAFGCGKSSLLLYINTLLAKNKDSEDCLTQLRDSDKELFDMCKEFTKNREFIRIKIIGEHISFKSQFKNSIYEHKYLKITIKYLKENDEFVMSKALSYIDKDLKNSNYSDIIFSIDEFGKFIEFGLDNIHRNDIFDLQTLAEYINKKKNYKLIISLHKSFNEYTNSLTNISYTDWDKIQGRFENIIFKDDYYEMLNIFKETISLKNSEIVKKAQSLISDISSKAILNKNSSLNLFKKIVPIHPFSAIVISEIFTRYFQNQRSIFSFLFSTEPNAFQEFITKEQKNIILYSLPNLYDYVAYLLKVYNILLPDREMWYKAEYRLHSIRVKTDIKQDIIKSISLIHSFKLLNLIVSNKNNLILALLDRYPEKDVEKSIEELIDDNILVYQEQTKSFSLLEDSNININKELKRRLEDNRSIDFEKELNHFIIDKFIVAKRYFIEYGTKRYFEKVYILKSENLKKYSYKIIFSDSKNSLLEQESKKSTTSLFIPLEDVSHIKILIKKIYILKEIQEEFSTKISIDTKEIIINMLSDYSITLEKLLNVSYVNSSIFYRGEEFSYSSKKLQKLLSEISKKYYPDTPMINNYSLNHTIAHKGTNTSSIKKLFTAMLENSNLKNLGIKRFPAEMALYLSVVKQAGIHQKINGKWQLCKPNALNFDRVWKILEENLVEKIALTNLITILANEPYGLNKIKSLFIISLYILVNEETIHIIQENTYKYTLTIDLLMNMWKATNKYQLQHIKLSRDEANLFKAYLQITTDLTEYSYSKDKVLSIIRTLYNKFTLLPHYAQNTQKISKEAIALRSAIISMKDPKEAFFILFPKALGYKSIQNISNEEFTQKFKKAFNEIALSYKREIIELEKYFSEIFYFENRFFPYGNELTHIVEKLLKQEALESEIKVFIRSFNYANNFLELIDNISIILIRKKIENCYDNDINRLKDKLKEIVKKILSKLELADIATEEKDIRKISLTSLDSNLNHIISINKNKLDIINQEVLKLKAMIPKEYNSDERIFLISQLLNEELKK